MTEECIHGLDLTRCAGCSPSPVPVAAPAPKAPPRTRSSSSTRKATPAPRRPASPKNAPPLDDIGQQRVYHVTHVDNLAGILETHSIFADTSESWTARPAIDIAAVATREARRSAPVTGLSDVPVAEYVPFALSPHASFWSSIRAGETDERLSPTVAGHSPTDFVVLVSTVKSVRENKSADATGGPGVVLADGDAADPLTRFAATPDDFARLLGRLRTADADTLVDVELLVRGSLSFDFVSLIGVANDKVREVVRRMLDNSGYEHRVAVYPPWYAATDEDE